MLLEKKTFELKIALAPYMFYWEEWIFNGNCNLSIEEIDFINSHIKNSFSSSVMGLIDFYSNAEAIRNIIRKLEIGYQVFKEFVVVDFLAAIVKMAKAYGYDRFMQTPIKDLEIQADLKSVMLAFGARTLHLLFIINKPEDFSRGWIYKNIIQFQISAKQQKLLNPR